MGGACCICGYARSPNALEFHHLDPSIKDFSFGSIRAEPKSWSKIVAELKKCVMLCANCHREVHDDVAFVPDNAPRFNIEFEDYRVQERAMRSTPCPVCNQSKRPDATTCSLRCAGVKRNRADWSKFDVLEMKTSMTLREIGKVVGVSDVAVAKRIKKLTGGT